MIAELEIRKRLIEFLSNPDSLDDFEDWLVSNSWNMHADSSEEAQKLVSEIELRLAEYSDDHIDFDTLRRELVPYATDINISLSYDKTAPTVVGASSSSTIAPLAVSSPPFQALDLYAGTTLVVECGYAEHR
jgi:hypothetical protein